jgi:hypothetical protein
MNATAEIIKIADIHVQRIELALKHVKHLFPITQEHITDMPDDDFVWLELLINRFGKLQDIIGAKIIDRFLEKEAENIEYLSTLDKVNKLEKLGIIKNASTWQEMRNARNHISHEYPEHPELRALYLNKIYQLLPELLAIWHKLKHALSV